MEKPFQILTINFGSTSTKLAVFENDTKIIEKTIRHTYDEIAPFSNIIDQLEFRKNAIIETLKSNNITIDGLDAVAGRGANLKSVKGGTYIINKIMINEINNKLKNNVKEVQHPISLCPIIAYDIASEQNIPAFVVDPPTVDEMDDVARISGYPDFPRLSRFHALNQKAIARRAAKELGRLYSELNLIVAHMGTGVTIGAHRKGCVVDANNGLDGDGPMSTERCGTIPFGDLANLCYSGKYTYDELRKKLIGKSGIYGYLNTNDGREVQKMIAAGDKKAELVYKAFAYQVAKEIGAAAVVLNGNVDAVCLTGGLAYDEILMGWIKEKVEFIAEVRIYPGEDELIAQAQGVLRVLKNEETAIEWQ